MKKLLLWLMALFVIPAALAGTIEDNYFYYGTEPVTDVDLDVFFCENDECNTLGTQLHDTNSGDTNFMRIEYPTNPLTYYGEYMFADGFIPLEYVVTDHCEEGWDCPHVIYDNYFEKAELCRSPVESMTVANKVYVNEPLMVNVKSVMDATTESAFTGNDEPPHAIPAGREDYYSALTDVTLTILYPGGVLAYTETKQVNILVDTSEDVEFEWTPTIAGKGYRAVITTDVVDDQCDVSQQASQEKSFDVLQARTGDICYAIINDLKSLTEDPYVGDTIELSYTSVSNFAEGEPELTPGMYFKVGNDTLMYESIEDGELTFIGEERFTVIYERSTIGDGTDTADTQIIVKGKPYDVHVMADEYTIIVDNNGDGVIDDYTLTPVDLAYSYDIMRGTLSDDQRQGVLGAGTTDPTLRNLDFTPSEKGYYTVYVSGLPVCTGVETYGDSMSLELYVDGPSPENNTAPYFVTIPVTTAEQNVTYYYDADAMDAEDDPLSYSLNEKPAGMTINHATGEIVWVPISAGTHYIEVLVTDIKGAYDVQAYYLIVEGNQPPYFTTTPDTSASVGKPFNYDADAVDPEGTTVTYELVLGKELCPFDEQKGLMMWIPLEAGTYNFIIEATDADGVSAQQSFTVVVDEDSKPYFITEPITLAQKGQEYVYDADAVDSDGDELVYGLELNPHGMKIDRQTGEITWTPQIEGHYHVRLTVSDGQNTAKQSYVLYVNTVISRESQLKKEGLVIAKARVDERVNAGDLIGMQVTVLNNQDIDVEDVEVAAYLMEYGIPSGEEVIDLDEGEQKQVFLTIPLYGDLEPGEYDVRVRIRSSEGQWDVEYRTVTIV